MPEGWCTDWNLTEDAVVTIKYIDPRYFENSLEAEYPFYTNTAYLFKDDKYQDNAKIEVDTPPIIEKSKLENGRFTITFNTGKYDLSKYETLTIMDEMSSNLFYRKGSIQITAVDTVGITRTLAYGTDYTLTVSENLHSLKIELIDPDTAQYIITYNVTTTGAAGDPYSNKASVEVYGKTFEDSSEGGLADAGFSMEEYVLSAHKTNAATWEPVAGAVYGLYSYQGELLATAVSDENGDIQFTGNPAAGFILTNDYLYYLQETEAPEGYLLSDTRYWFYYDDSEPDTIAWMKQEAQMLSLYREGDIETEVTNHGYTDKLYSDYTTYAKPIEVTDEEKGYVLPETGGAGTTLYTAGGAALLALAGLMYMILRRKGDEAP